MQKVVAIIGGTGKAGSRIAEEALEQGYHVRMLVRSKSKVANIDTRIEIVEGNVQRSEDINRLLQDCNVVVNTFGQPIDEKQTYSKVTETIFDMMYELNITRYVGVTGGSLTIEGDKKSFINKCGTLLFKLIYPRLLEEKINEWHYINNNRQIQWSLIRLPFIKDGVATGHIKESLVNMPGTKIVNGDIAKFIVNEISDCNYIHKAPFISN